MIQFLDNIKRRGWKLILEPTTAALILFPILFHGYLTSVCAAEELLPPIFGQGNIKVRLYADYFCSPCRAMSPKVEPVLTELIKKNTITLIFIDTPFYKYSSMYARYFLYAMYRKNDFESAIKARKLLITAATQNIKEAAKLEEMLKDNNVWFKVFDIKPIFAVFSSQLQDDMIQATPSCVIERCGKKEIFEGDTAIIQALEDLLLCRTQ